MKNLSSKPKDNAGAPRASNPFAAAAPSVNVVVIFDTPRHLAEAREILNRLIGTCDPDMAIHADEWSMIDLDHDRFRQEAMELARHCDIFVIASDSISDAATAFTAEWLAGPRDGSAALVLIAFSRHFVGSFEFFGLRPLARENHVDYFSTVIEDTPSKQKVGGVTIADSPTQPSPLNE